jgi:hypothetical protein
MPSRTCARHCGSRLTNVQVRDGQYLVGYFHSVIAYRDSLQPAQHEAV